AHELDAAAGGWRAHTRGGALCARVLCGGAAHVPCERKMPLTGQGRVCTRCTKSKTHSKKAVPVPSVHYRFPVSLEDGAAPTSSPQPQLERERQRNVTVSPCSGGGSTRARDSGRTQSGGVREVLIED
ncbi:hypothetical protein C8R44DRAFT_823111, partial [Mycena epipterygia]